MIWTIITVILFFLPGIYIGYKKYFYLEQLSIRLLLKLAVGAVFILFILRLLHNFGYFPEAIAGTFMAVFYGLLAGFFLGTSYRQYRNKSKFGKIIYYNKSFSADALPNLIALVLIIAGIVRTSIFTEAAITPIRITSGLSLISLGVFGLSMHIIPEFRAGGFILLDRTIQWDSLLSYKWVGEEVMELEFEYHEVLKVYHTVIPADDRPKVDAILSDILIQKLKKEKDEGVENESNPE